LQDPDEDQKLMLVEVYRDEDAHAKLKETSLCKRWKKQVKEMMNDPRKKKIFTTSY